MSADTPAEPTTTRRGAIKYAAAAGAMLLLHGAAAGLAFAAHAPSQSPAAPNGDADPFRFALISDTHLGRDGEKPSAQMRQAVEEINASPAEIVIHCGDLVNAGERPENEKRYPEFLDLASKFARPWHAVPGNHDPLALFPKHVRRETDYVVERHPWRFVCFRDALPNPEHDGAVAAAQIAFIQKSIDEAAAAGRRVILVSHITHHET